MTTTLFALALVLLVLAVLRLIGRAVGLALRLLLLASLALGLLLAFGPRPGSVPGHPSPADASGPPPSALPAPAP